MFINQVYYEPLQHCSDSMISVSRHSMQYFRDLFNRKQTDLDCDFNEKIYKTDFLADRLFEKIKENNIKIDTDYLFFANWGYRWHAEFSSIELYWKVKFHIAAELVDVQDCGSLCVFHALLLMHQLYQSSYANTGFCLSLENRSLLKNKSNIPEVNYIAYLKTSKILEKGSVFEIMLFTLSQTKNIDEFIIKTACEYQIKPFEYSVIRRNELDVISSNFLYRSIYHLYTTAMESLEKYFFIIDYDPSITLFGIALIRKIK